MDEEIPARGRSRLEGGTVTNLPNYRVEIFYVAIDKIFVKMFKVRLRRWFKLKNIWYFHWSTNPLSLTLILSVSTTSVERAFSTMKIIKSKLHNKINDLWLNDLMIYSSHLMMLILFEHLLQRGLGKGIYLIILFSTLLAGYIFYLLFQIVFLLTK